MPRAIMYRVLHGPVAQALNFHNQAAFAPPVTAASRAVVMPSPDMLYALCHIDVSQGPVQVEANPQLPTYWSIALYASNSDNVFTLNDRQTAGQAVRLWLAANPRDAARAPVGSTVVRVPGTQALLLMRVLTSDYAREQAQLEAARRTLRCTPAAS
jgi:uncharacterized membrane protein